MSKVRLILTCDSDQVMRQSASLIKSNGLEEVVMGVGSSVLNLLTPNKEGEMVSRAVLALTGIEVEYDE